MARAERLRDAALLAACALEAALARAGTPTSPLQDVLRPGGPQAQHVASLWHLMLAICTLVFVAVMVALVIALLKRPHGRLDAPPDLASLSVPEPGAHRSVATAIGASTVLLLFLIVASVLTDRALANISTKGALTLKVTADQWWWQVTYDGPPSEAFDTANEIHVPVGRPVVVRLQADDVIHSLWVPSLAGKKDLIPGRDATLQFRADKPGIYRGQCAEFCGAEHAWMAFEVVAEPPERYAAWVDHQRQPAPPPGDPLRQKGQTLFVSTTCAMCHAVRGTTASARHAPDLTHLASRRTLAAGTLPNTPEALRAWIRDPHKFKPGVNMPATNMPDADLDAIVAWLGTLS
ncbi:MAG TPA: cytochrome c oxidase subunit II [Burkholderiaceae bacterium]